MTGGLLLAVLAIAFIAAACYPTPSPPPPPPPPPTPTPTPMPAPALGQLTLSPASVDYGAHALVSLMANMPIIQVTVMNTGGQAVQLSSEIASNGIYSMPTNTCAGASLAPGQSCSIGLQYCPSAIGTVAATLTVTGMSGTMPVSSTVNVTGSAQ